MLASPEWVITVIAVTMPKVAKASQKTEPDSTSEPLSHLTERSRQSLSSAF